MRGRSWRGRGRVGVRLGPVPFDGPKGQGRRVQGPAGLL